MKWIWSGPKYQICDDDGNVLKMIGIEEQISKQKVKEVIEAIETFINIDRDMYGKVTMEDVRKGLKELKTRLRLE